MPGFSGAEGGRKMYLKKILSVVLAAAMVTSMAGMTALAGEPGDPAGSSQVACTCQAKCGATVNDDCPVCGGETGNPALCQGELVLGRSGGEGEITSADGLQTALDNAPAGETITLGGDITLTQTLKVNKNKAVTLDLNGWTISGEAAPVVTVSGSDSHLTIEDGDSGEGGAILLVKKTFTTKVLNIEKSGAATLAGGTIGTGEELEGTKVYEVYPSGGTFTMTGGAVRSNDNIWAYFTNATISFQGGKLYGPTGLAKKYYDSANMALVREADSALTVVSKDNPPEDFHVKYGNQLYDCYGSLSDGSSSLFTYYEPLAGEATITVREGGGGKVPKTSLSTSGSVLHFILEDGVEVWAEEGKEITLYAGTKVLVEGNGSLDEAAVVLNPYDSTIKLVKTENNGVITYEAVRPMAFETANGQYDLLDNALKNLGDDGVITLLEDAKQSTLTVLKGQTVTLDLGGHTLTLSGATSVYDFQIGNSDSEFNGFDTAVRNQGSLTIKHGTLEVTGNKNAIVNCLDGVLDIQADATVRGTYGMYGNKNVIVNVGSTVTTAGSLVSDANNGISTYGGVVKVTGGQISAAGSSEATGIAIYNRAYNNESAGAEVTISGGTIQTSDYGVSGNGVRSGGSDPSSLTITGGTISSGLTCVYWPATGTLTVGNEDGSGPELTSSGSSAIQFCSGTMLIRGGVFNGNGPTSIPTDEELVEQYRGNSGASNVGDAVAIITRRGSGYTTGPIQVVISGGQFNSAANYGVRYMDCNTAPGADQLAQEVTVNVTGGTFSGKLGSVNAEFVTEEDQKFISGGRFAMGAVDQAIHSYVKTGYYAWEDNGCWVVSEQDGTVTAVAEDTKTSVDAQQVEIPQAPGAASVPSREDVIQAAEEIQQQVSGNPAVDSVPPTGLVEAAEGIIEVPANSVIQLYLEVELQDLSLEAQVDEAGAVTLLPASLTFDVTPMQREYGTANGTPVAELNGRPVTFRLPIPASVTARYAKVTHEGDANRYVEIETHQESGRKYIELTVTHFSPFEVTFANQLPTSSHGGEDDFWARVQEKIEDADPGDTIHVNAGSYHKMPYLVMEALGKADRVTLVISWSGGKDIEISKALTTEAGRIYYPLSYLEGLGLTASGDSAVILNPETGGILVIPEAGTVAGAAAPMEAAGEARQQAALASREENMPLSGKSGAPAFVALGAAALLAAGITAFRKGKKAE